MKKVSDLEAVMLSKSTPSSTLYICLLAIGLAEQRVLVKLAAVDEHAVSREN